MNYTFAVILYVIGVSGYMAYIGYDIGKLRGKHMAFMKTLKCMKAAGIQAGTILRVMDEYEANES